MSKQTMYKSTEVAIFQKKVRNNLRLTNQRHRYLVPCPSPLNKNIKKGQLLRVIPEKEIIKGS